MTAASGKGACGLKSGICGPGLFFVLTVINALLVRYGELFKPGEFGLPGLYLAVGFMITFGLWFGLWGVFAAFAGYLLGAALPTGVPATAVIFIGLADLIQVLIPVVAFRSFAADPGLGTRRDLLVYLAFGWLLNNLTGALIGSGSLVLVGSIPPDLFLASFSGWLVGNLIVTLVVTTALLRLGTPFIRRWGVMVERYWC
jgi:hypothetical protein